MQSIRGYFISNDKKIDLKFEETTVGRLSSNVIAINDPTVSKNHAVVNYLSGRNKFYVTDLNTVNGTFVNGVKLEGNRKC